MWWNSPVECSPKPIVEQTALRPSPSRFSRTLKPGDLCVTFCIQPVAGRDDVGTLYTTHRNTLSRHTLSVTSARASIMDVSPERAAVFASYVFNYSGTHFHKSPIKS